MSDEGYTLPDTLAALAILSLAMGGVMAGGLLLTRVQGRADYQIARGMGLKRASVALDDLLGAAGPFRSQDADFSGTADTFEFSCGTARCGARLVASGEDTLVTVTRPSNAAESITLKGFSQVRFDYVSDHGAGSTWPRVSARPERLRQLILLQTDRTPLAQIGMVVDQPMNCEFDVVSQDCR